MSGKSLEHAAGIRWFEETFGVPLGDKPGEVDVARVRELARTSPPNPEGAGAVNKATIARIIRATVRTVIGHGSVGISNISADEAADQILSLLPGEGDHVADAGKMIAPGEGSGWRELLEAAEELSDAVRSVGWQMGSLKGRPTKQHLNAWSASMFGASMRLRDALAALSPTQEGSTKGEGE